MLLVFNNYFHYCRYNNWYSFIFKYDNFFVTRSVIFQRWRRINLQAATSNKCLLFKTIYTHIEWNICIYSTVNDYASLSHYANVSFNALKQISSNYACHRRQIERKIANFFFPFQAQFYLLINFTYSHSHSHTYIYKNQ